MMACYILVWGFALLKEWVHTEWNNKMYTQMQKSSNILLKTNDNPKILNAFSLSCLFKILHAQK